MKDVTQTNNLQLEVDKNCDHILFNVFTPNDIDMSDCCHICVRCGITDHKSSNNVNINNEYKNQKEAGKLDGKILLQTTLNLDYVRKLYNKIISSVDENNVANIRITMLKTIESDLKKEAIAEKRMQQILEQEQSLVKKKRPNYQIFGLFRASLK